jgi:DNA-binding transcriptional MerR regulator
MEEPWTILELAGLAADALTEPTGPTGPLADAGMPSAETGSSAVAGRSAETGSSAGAGRSGETRASAGARLGAEAGSPGETAAPAGGGAPSGRVRANGRVRDVPNERLIRWYVTVGLVDPPLSRRGRVARYGRRHLLQLVAVKRRQAEGRSLAEIQAELAGATDETLAAVARLMDTSPAPQAPPAAPDRFWARQPREPGPALPDEERPGQTGPVAAARPGRARAVAAVPLRRTGPAAAERRGAPASAGARGGGTDRGTAGPTAGLVYGIRLAPGVTVLLEGADREPGPDDLTEIANAAEPLLRELASRGFRAFGPGHPADVAGRSPGAGQPAEERKHDH